MMNHQYQKGGRYESAIASIQVEYPTDLYLSKILLQFEQSVINICTKIYNVDKNYKFDIYSTDSIYIVEGVLLMIQKCKL